MRLTINRLLRWMDSTGLSIGVTKMEDFELSLYDLEDSGHKYQSVIEVSGVQVSWGSGKTREDAVVDAINNNEEEDDES